METPENFSSLNNRDVPAEIRFRQMQIL